MSRNPGGGGRGWQGPWGRDNLQNTCKGGTGGAKGIPEATEILDGYGSFNEMRKTDVGELTPRSTPHPAAQRQGAPAKKSPEGFLQQANPCEWSRHWEMAPGSRGLQLASDSLST